MQEAATKLAPAAGALNMNIPFFAVTVGASIESFYRSAMNAFINASLTGHRAALFPNMHVQLPTRVVYINGFKATRIVVDNAVPKDAGVPVRLAAACTPGIIMTPVSSILEACNAGHMNPEPLAKRFTRGTVARGGREVIFGIGLNQASDKFEAAYKPMIANAALCNMAGSLTAGVLSGYLSHVPHNMSTLKLMQPQKSYSTLFWEYAKKSEGMMGTPKTPGASAFMSIVFPRGCLVRTAQIVGSFIILNGSIFALKDVKIL